VEMLLLNVIRTFRNKYAVTFKRMLETFERFRKKLETLNYE